MNHPSLHSSSSRRKGTRRQGARGAAALSALIRAYACFEREVRKRMEEFCGPYCAACPTLCCREVFCRETRDSAWLHLVRDQQAAVRAAYDLRNGWVTSKGCALDVGRPPVCYEYFCAAIAKREEPVRMYAAHVLGRLVSFIGRNAVGRRHIVELAHAEELPRIRLQKVAHQIEEAKDALACCVAILRREKDSQGLVSRLRGVKRIPDSLNRCVSS